MIDLSPLVRRLAGTPLAAWADSLPAELDERLTRSHGDLQRWKAALQALPALTAERIELNGRVSLSGTCHEETRAALRQALLGLSPWRKGPFELFGVLVDTEWRSDWKWQRVAPHLDLRGRRILDVGCGNGYYMWRMLGAGADCVIGIDPNWLFFCQFLALRHYLPELPAWHLPLALEDLPEKLEGFDTVFSMGVLYHRRSPIDHLLALKDCLRPGANCCWKPWWSTAMSAPCWCRRTATRRCATSGSCPRWRPWNCGCAAPASSRCAAWMSPSPP